MLVLPLVISLGGTSAAFAKSCCAGKAKTAQKTEELKGLSIQFVSEVSTVKPGEPFRVGFRIKHQPKFHTYWKNPGIVGVPTAFKWKLPKGSSVSEVAWPSPELSKMASYPCFGYERDVMLMVTITPPKVLSTKVFDLVADGQWMCCAENCFPGFKTFKMSLAVGENAVTSEEAPLFKAADKDLPVTEHKYTAELVSKPDAKMIVVKLGCSAGKPFKIARIFNSDGQTTPSQQSEGKKLSDSEYYLTFERYEYSPKGKKNFPFVLQTDKGFYEVVAK